MEKDLSHSTFNPDEALRARSILRTALPLMAGLLLEQLIGLTDVLFLGRYGEVELAAAGVAGIYVMLLIMIGWGYCIGAQSMMSRANGAGDHARTGRIFRQSALFLTAGGVAVTLLSFLFFDPVFGRSLGDGPVREAAWDYVFWRTAALPVAYLCILGRVFFVSILRAKILTWSSLVMVLVNCALNAVLIFGLGPFPEMGIAGAAIASALAEFACLGVLFGRLAWERKWLERCLRGSWAFDRGIQGELIRLGRWLMLQEAAAFGVWLFFFIAVEHAAGERALAVSNVVRQLGAMLFLFVHAFGSTCGSVAANLTGAGAPGRVPEVARLGLKLCFALISPVALVYLVFPEAVLGILTDLPEVIEDAVPPFYVMLASYVLTVPCYFFFMMIEALGCVKESFRTMVAASLIYALYIGLLTMTTTSTAVFWTSDFVFGAGVGIGSWLAWRRRSWEKPVEERA